MLSLRTFGTVALSRTDGGTLDPAADQRRLQALLVAIAAAGEGGLSRDRALLLLWTEREPGRGRHALTQSLYHARKSLACPDLFLPGPDLRLNPARITSDVGAFVAAIARRDWAAAERLYAGPFLDGFQVTGAPEFERWGSAQQRTLADQAARAIEHLARSAEAAGDHEDVVRLRKRAMDIDPFDSAANGRLLQALAASGNRAGALREAEAHASLLRSELEVEPDAAFKALVARLRRDERVPELPPPASAAPPGVVAPAIPTAPARPVAVAPAIPIAVAPASAPARWWSRRRALALGVAALAAAAIVATVTVLRGAGTPVPSDLRLVVAPFRVSGAEPSVRFLREGIVELLSTRLGDERVPSSVDPGAVLGAWRTARLIDAHDVPREQVLRVARRLGASAVVSGSVVGNPNHLVVTGVLIRDARDIPDRVATVAGPLDSLGVMVDRLAGKLLVLRAGEDERFADRMTPSLPALREFLDGLAAYRSEGYVRAARHLDAALRADSTFALAALQLAIVTDRINVTEQHDRALAIAWRYRFDLSDRDRAHLVALAGPRYPQPSTEAEQLSAWLAVVALSPERGDAWVELGERFLTAGRVLGVPAFEARAEHAWKRALELNPDDRSLHRRLALLAARTGDTAALRGRLTLAGGDTPDGLGVVARWRAALALGDRAQLDAVRRDMPRLTGDALRAIALTSQYDAVGITDGDRALRIRRGRGETRVSERLDDILAQHSLALNQGHPVLALDLTEQLEELQPGSRAHLRLRVLDALYGGGDTAAARAAVTALETVRATRTPDDASVRAVRLADACVLAQWHVAHGRYAPARRLVATLRESGVPDVSVPVGANPHTCTALLDAMLATFTGAPDAMRVVSHVDSLMLGGPAASDAGAYAHLIVAQLWERLGQPGRALDAIRRRPYLAGWPRYLATARLEEGRLATFAGDRRGASIAYREYLALRPSPARRLETEVTAVRAAEAALHNQ